MKQVKKFFSLCSNPCNYEGMLLFTLIYLLHFCNAKTLIDGDWLEFHSANNDGNDYCLLYFSQDGVVQSQQGTSFVLLEIIPLRSILDTSLSDLGRIREGSFQDWRFFPRKHRLILKQARSHALSGSCEDFNKESIRIVNFTPLFEQQDPFRKS